MGWGGNEKGAEGRGKDELRGRGRERAPAKGTSLRGRGCTPVPGAERVRPASGSLRPGQRARKGDEEARSSSRAASQLRTGRSELQCLPGVESGDNGRSPRRKARAAGPSARPAGQLSRPRHPGRQLRRDAGPALGGRAGYLKRGESFRHSSKSTVIFTLPLPPPCLAGGAGGA